MAVQIRADEISEIIRSQIQGFDRELNVAETGVILSVGEIKKQLEVRTGKEVILSLERDPSLLGGALTKIGNVIYDGSLKTQLKKVRENLYKE